MIIRWFVTIKWSVNNQKHVSVVESCTLYIGTNIKNIQPLIYIEISYLRSIKIESSISQNLVDTIQPSINF